MDDKPNKEQSEFLTAPLRHRWSLKFNFLSGLTLDDWSKLLRANEISPAYWHRAAFVSLIATFNSLHCWRERKFDKAVSETEIKSPPTFILGHWRSGTTHLHNILALDSANFAFCNTYQVTNPLNFLTTEPTRAARIAWMLPKKRPMDDMEIGVNLPQEDEFALCLMTLKSVLLGHSFPRQENFYNRYMTFEGVSGEEIDAWKKSMLWFCKKLTLKYQRPLVLKSPPHTARIRILLELFPDARFIHIHRHPHDVFRSTRHQRNTAFWYYYMQRPDRAAIDNLIISRYRALYDAYFSQRDLISPSRLYELSFEELERNPVEQVQRLYCALGLAGFSSFEPSLRDYAASSMTYRKNSFEPLDTSLRKRLADAWANEFHAWNYQP